MDSFLDALRVSAFVTTGLLILTITILILGTLYLYKEGNKDE